MLIMVIEQTFLPPYSFQLHPKFSVLLWILLLSIFILWRLSEYIQQSLIDMVEIELIFDKVHLYLVINRWVISSAFAESISLSILSIDYLKLRVWKFHQNSPDDLEWYWEHLLRSFPRVRLFDSLRVSRRKVVYILSSVFSSSIISKFLLGPLHFRRL